jgi:hypothetical protein
MWHPLFGRCISPFVHGSGGFVLIVCGLLALPSAVVYHSMLSAQLIELHTLPLVRKPVAA